LALKKLERWHQFARAEDHGVFETRRRITERRRQETGRFTGGFAELCVWPKILFQLKQNGESICPLSFRQGLDRY
jgi:hypothetical protein